VVNGELSIAAKGLPSRECRSCRGVVEPELTAIHPASEVCLDCMAEPERRRLEEDLNRVQALDRSLLPELPRLDGWEIGVHYRPSRILSGDFYDVRKDGEPAKLHFLLGDVMGKGIPAALLRTGLSGSLRALASEIASPSRVLEKANRHFVESGSTARLASVFYGSLDVGAGRLRYANAGHLPPLVRKADGTWRSLDPTGMVLGALDQATYGEAEVELEPRDLLVLYSDGITEAANEAGEFFEPSRMTSLIDARVESSVQSMASAIAGAVARFSPGDPSDDRTLVVVRRS
jgi:sigma-B regulation protein RsbU (phosphoserine phosphatase)